ncbi:LANO_0C04500g1_1 [Lachancea nothofagi CBS 11611]|uniref:LANO_0C04500g1_1 n=1 Tax=Lachancea nothofagi CBS 11611 TaxID=1266666 RepID=A0A1G4J7E0_9SACH|nr:LANO_0C04500g1_1 [Lachancea nothofagi CBS 11611]
MKFTGLGTALILALDYVTGHKKADTIEEKYMGPDAAAKIARKLALHEGLLHANTIDEKSGTPVSFVEYFVGSDTCRGVETSSNGNIILLLLNMSSTYQNWNADSKLSVSIEAHHGFGKPAMASPRANYFGELKPLEKSKALEHCFLKRHPDARWWIPDGEHDKVHDAKWFELDVSEVYFIGGFGDRAYIGTVSGEDYHGAFNHSRPGHHGVKMHELDQETGSNAELDSRPHREDGPSAELNPRPHGEDDHDDHDDHDERRARKILAPSKHEDFGHLEDHEESFFEHDRESKPIHGASNSEDESDERKSSPENKKEANKGQRGRKGGCHGSMRGGRQHQ